MRSGHDVGVDDERHDPRGVFGIIGQLIELILGPLEVLSRRVVLNEHHCHVVAFLRVGDARDGRAFRPQFDRLIVEDPVGDILVSLFAAELTAARARDGLIAPAWFVSLRDAARRFTAAVESGDAAASTRLNMQFHDLIVDASGNEFLAEAHRRAIARLAVSTALNLERADWAKEAARQHDDIANAIANGDVVEARSLSEAHIRGAQHVFDEPG